jgi:hypothetical protein
MACGDEGNKQMVARRDGPVCSSHAAENGWNFDKMIAAAARTAKIMVLGARGHLSQTPEDAACHSRRVLRFQGNAPSTVHLGRISGICKGVAHSPWVAVVMAVNQIRMGEAAGLSSVVPFLAHCLLGTYPIIMGSGPSRAGWSRSGQRRKSRGSGLAADAVSESRPCGASAASLDPWRAARRRLLGARFSEPGASRT